MASISDVDICLRMLPHFVGNSKVVVTVENGETVSFLKNSDGFSVETLINNKKKQHGGIQSYQLFTWLHLINEKITGIIIYNNGNIIYDYSL